MIPLELIPKIDKKYFLNKRFYEPIDVDRFTRLLQCNGDVFITKKGDTGGEHNGEDRNQYLLVKKLLENYDAESKSIVVQYSSSDRGNCSWGRVYPNGMMSAGEVSGDIRSWLLFKQWTSFDMANCHPNIVYQAFKMNGYRLEALGEYCLNREKHIVDVQQRFNVDRKAAKLLFIRLLYGGSFEAWRKDSFASYVEAGSFVENFMKDVETAKRIIVDANHYMLSTLKANKKSEEKMKRGPGRPRKMLKQDVAAASTPSDDQIVSTWCSEIERRCLEAMFSYLVEKGVIDADKPTCMLRYDGIDLPMSSISNFNKDELMRGMEQVIFRDFGLEIQVTEKAYVLPEKLDAEIEEQLDFESKMQGEDYSELTCYALSKLKYYQIQKRFWEKFVAQITGKHEFLYNQPRTTDAVGDGCGGAPSRCRVTSWECGFSKRADLITIFDSVETIVPGMEDKKGLKFIDVWLKDIEKREYARVEFVPFNKDVEKLNVGKRAFYNLFNGFCVPKIPPPENYKFYTRCFHNIGLQLFEEDPVMYTFFWKALVKLFKYPRQRLGQAFAFQGKEQGSGFDVYFNTIGRLLGTSHYNNTADVEGVLGTYAEGFQNRLLVVLNELKFDDIRNSRDKLKALITELRSEVNPKGVRRYKVDNYALFVFCSNNVNSVIMDVGGNERRMNVCKPTDHTVESNHAAHNWGYSSSDWDYFVKYFQTDVFLAALYRDIMETDIKTFDSKKFRPLMYGAEYFRCSEENSPLHAKFLAHLIRQGEVDKDTIHFKKVEGTDDVRVNCTEFSTLFKKWLEGAKNLQKNGKYDWTWRSLCSPSGTYFSVIKIKKLSNEFFQFNTKELWTFLQRKRWVQEGFKLYEEKKQELLKYFEVEERFVELSKLYSNTRYEDRPKVNPGKDRPIDLDVPLSDGF